MSGNKQKLNFEAYLNKDTENSILYIHGNSSSKNCFKNQISFFTNYNQYSVDLLGHGDSERISNATNDPMIYSIKHQAESLLQLIEEQNINNINLIAHSFGGHVALALASQIKNKIRSISLLNTSPLETSTDLIEAFMPHPEVAFFFSNQVTLSDLAPFGDFLKIHEYFENFKSDFLNTDPNFRSNLAISSSQAGNIGEVSFIKESKLPVFALVSKEEKMLNPDYLNKLTDKLDDSQFSLGVLESPSHYAHFEASDEFNSKINIFLKNFN